MNVMYMITYELKLAKTTSIFSHQPAQKEMNQKKNFSKSAIVPTIYKLQEHFLLPRLVNSLFHKLFFRIRCFIAMYHLTFHHSLIYLEVYWDPSQTL